MRMRLTNGLQNGRQLRTSEGENMVRCIDCSQCVPMKSEIDKRRFLGCDLRIRDLADQDNPEKWKLWEANPQVLEKIAEVQPFEDHDCSKLGKRTAHYGDHWFDKTKGESYDAWIRNWWFKHGVSKPA